MKNEVKSVWICGSFTFNLIVYRYLKTVNIMAKFEIKFYDLSDLTTAVVYKPLMSNSIQIELECPKSGEWITIQFDKSTAIKFAKTLRTEINKITESEVSNG